MRAEKERPKREFSDDFFSLFRTKFSPARATCARIFFFMGMLILHYILYHMLLPPPRENGKILFPSLFAMCSPWHSRPNKNHPAPRSRVVCLIWFYPVLTQALRTESMWRVRSSILLEKPHSFGAAFGVPAGCAVIRP